MDWTGKIVLITGASSGIGALTAQAVAAKGAVPVLTGRSRNKLEAAVLGITAEHAVYTMDVTSDDDVERVITDVLKRFDVSTSCSTMRDTGNSSALRT